MKHMKKVDKDDPPEPIVISETDARDFKKFMKAKKKAQKTGARLYIIPK